MRFVPGLATGTALLLIPPLLVGAWGLVPGPLCVPLALAVLFPCYLWLRGGEAPRRAVRVSNGHRATGALLLLLALVQLGRVGIFVVDPARRQFAALPMADEWALYHACFTGYTEAARLASEGRANIYDGKNYEQPDGRSRRIGLLFVDEYEYPPPFLPLPTLLTRLTGHDVVRARALFFGLQALTLTLVMVGSAMRLPDPAAVTAWRLIPGVLAAFQTIVGMQYGNFQAGAFALAMAGMLAITGTRPVLGAPILAFTAASKVFPGVLVLLLAGARRRRAVIWTMAWMAAFGMLSLIMFGTRPYVDFVTYEIPAITSGSGFSWSRLPFLIPTNYGVSAVVLKLTALGMFDASFGTAMQIASLYGLSVIGLTAIVAWRSWRSPSARAALADSPLVWLALLNLASFRSPYVADAQATMGTLWLLALVIALRGWQGWRLALAAVAWVGWALTFEGIAPPEHFAPLLVATLVLQLSAVAFNAWVVIAALNAREPSSSAADANRQHRQVIFP